MHDDRSGDGDEGREVRVPLSYAAERAREEYARGWREAEADMGIRATVRGVTIVPLEAVRRAYTRHALAVYRGNVSAAAAALGIARSTVYDYAGEVRR